MATYLDNLAASKTKPRVYIPPQKRQSGEAPVMTGGSGGAVNPMNPNSNGWEKNPEPPPPPKEDKSWIETAAGTLDDMTGNVVSSGYNYISDGLSDAANGVAGVATDLFSADTADVPDVTPGMYQVGKTGSKAIGDAIAAYGNAANNAAQNIKGVAGGASSDIAATGASVAGDVRGAASDLGAQAGDAIREQSGVAGDMNEAARRASSGAQQGFTADQSGVLGAKNNALDLANLNTRTDAIGRDLAGTDVSAPLRGAVDAAGNMVNQASNNAGTQNLLNWKPGMTGASGASQDAQGYLAGYGTAQNNGLDRYRDFRTGVQPGANTAGAAGSLGALGQSLLKPSANSEAEAQMKMGLDANVAAQFALANSGRGAYNGDAMRQAQSTAATLGQQTAAQTAQLRAKETADRLALAQQAFSSQGQIGQGMDQTNLAAEQNRMQQLADISGMEVDSAAKASAAAATNDEIALNAQGQALGAVTSGASAVNADTRNSIDAVNALTNAAGSTASSDLNKYGLMSTLANQGDTFDLNKGAAVNDAYRGIRGDALSEYLGDTTGRATYGNLERDLLAGQSGAYGTGRGQAIDAQSGAMQGYGTAGNLELTGATNAGNLLTGATITADGLIVDAQGNVLSTIEEYWNSEAARKAALAGTWINAETQASVSNTQADTAKDGSVAGMLGAAAGVIGFL